MEEILRNVQLARDYAMGNHYETASIMLQTTIQDITHYLRGCQDERLKVIIRKVQEACQTEIRSMNDLIRDTGPALLEPNARPASLPEFSSGPNYGMAREDSSNGHDPQDYVVAARRPAPLPRPVEDEADWGFEDRRAGGRPGWDATPGSWDPNPPRVRRPIPGSGPPPQQPPVERAGRRVPRADHESRGRSAGAANRLSHQIPAPASAPPPAAPSRPMRKPDVPRAGARGGGLGSGVGGGVGDKRKSKMDEEDREIVAMIEREIVEKLDVTWDEVAGLDEAQALLKEAVVHPLWMPNIFTGIRKPWSGVLLYGPPGTGKTYLAKAVASESGSTFFNVSVATMTSKNRGDSEKLVRALFEMARQKAPSVIFIDEIDGLSGQRGNSNEHEASRRVKTELLVQMDGMSSNSSARVMVLGATNHPWDLDDAMRRRLEKRIYISLPEERDRLALIKLKVRDLNVAPDVDFQKLAKATAGFSCADIKILCRDAAMMQMRAMRKEKSLQEMKGAEEEIHLAPLLMDHFLEAIAQNRTTVSAKNLAKFTTWMAEFGTKAVAKTSGNTHPITLHDLELWEHAAPGMRGHYNPPAGTEGANRNEPPKLGKLRRKTDGVKTARDRKKFEAASKEEKDLADVIERDIVVAKIDMPWSRVAGLERAKELLEEAVSLPLLMPEFFTGIRSPMAGILLYGPPGTGKTLLAKALATECNTTFFNVSTASVTSKWRGDSEKLIRILFQMARHYAPSTIFIDEIDALSTQRGGGSEDDASRRMKTQLLTEMDGITSALKDSPAQVMVLGATNHPWDLDEAMLRRLEKRILIPLPEEADRMELFRLDLQDVPVEPDVDFAELARLTSGYSGHDITCVCRDAAMAKVRRLVKDKSPEELKQLGLRPHIELPVNMTELRTAIRNTPPSVSQTQVIRFEKWMEDFDATKR